MIAERAELGITVRALSQASLERLAAAVERTVSAECTATGCPRDPEIRTVSRSPVTLSDPEAGAAVRQARRKLYGPERVCGWPPSMATEDFPLCSDAGAELHGGTGKSAVYWMVGATGAREWSRASVSGRSGSPEPPAANHSPLFAPDVRTGLPTAVTALTTAALVRLGGAEPAGTGP